MQLRPNRPQIAFQDQQAAAFVVTCHGADSRDEAAKPAEQFFIAVMVGHGPDYLMLEISVSYILLTAVITCEAAE